MLKIAGAYLIIGLILMFIDIETCYRHRWIGWFADIWFLGIVVGLLALIWGLEA